MNFLYKSIVGGLSAISFNVLAGDINKFDYFGIGLANSSYDELVFSPQIDTAELTPLVYDDKSSAMGYRMFAGHQFNRYVAVEVGLASFGQVGFTVKELTTGTDDKVTKTTIEQGKFKTLSGDVRVVGTYSLSDSLFLKAHVGVIAWSNKFTFLTGKAGALTSEELSDKGVSLTTGVGVGYGFSKRIAMSFDAERTEIADIATQNLGVSFFVRF